MAAGGPTAGPGGPGAAGLEGPGGPGGPGGTLGLAGILSIMGGFEVCGFTSIDEFFALRGLF